jgi:hypothetical protein
VIRASGMRAHSLQQPFGCSSSTCGCASSHHVFLHTMYFFTPTRDGAAHAPTRDGAARTATSTWYSVQAQCAGAGRPSLMECALFT